MRARSFQSMCTYVWPTLIRVAKRRGVDTTHWTFSRDRSSGRLRFYITGRGRHHNTVIAGPWCTHREAETGLEAMINAYLALPDLGA